MSLLINCMYYVPWIGVGAQVWKEEERRDLHWIWPIRATGLSYPTGELPQENCQPGEYISVLNHCLVARQLDKTGMSSLIVCMIKCTTETWQVFQKIKSVFLSLLIGSQCQDCTTGTALCQTFTCPLLDMNTSATLTVRAHLWNSTLLEVSFQTKLHHLSSHYCRFVRCKTLKDTADKSEKFVLAYVYCGFIGFHIFYFLHSRKLLYSIS